MTSRSTSTCWSRSSSLAAFESFRPDLILLDYQMPDMNGIAVMKELKSRGNDAPVILLTAYGTIERAVLAMKEGAYDFIPKPFEPDHLVLTRSEEHTSELQSRL